MEHEAATDRLAAGAGACRSARSASGVITAARAGARMPTVRTVFHGRVVYPRIPPSMNLPAHRANQEREGVLQHLPGPFAVVKQLTRMGRVGKMSGPAGDTAIQMS